MAELFNRGLDAIDVFGLFKKKPKYDKDGKLIEEKKKGKKAKSKQKKAEDEQAKGKK